MRTAAIVLTLLASFTLSACASGSTFDRPARDMATSAIWSGRLVYTVQSRALPVVDTTAQREALRRVPHAADRPAPVNGQR